MPKKEHKYHLGKPTEEQGIFKNLDENGNEDGTFSVRISRRFKIDSQSRTSFPLFARKRTVATFALAKKVKRELEDRLHAKAIKMGNGDKPWKDAVDNYLAHLQDRLDDKTMSISTVDNIQQTLKKHTNQWNFKMLSWFNINIFESYLNSPEIKKDISYATRKNILKFIRQVFKRQVAVGTINHNPTNGVHVRRSQYDIDVNQPDREPKAMMKEDFYKVYDYAREHFPQWADVYFFSYNTGLRSGEAFSLVWKNVEFNDKNPEDSKVHVKTSYDWKREKILPVPKNKVDRSVPMNPELYFFLKELKLKSDPDSEFVLPRIQDWKNGKAAEQLREMQKAAKVVTTNFHAIRGTFCTNLLLRGEAPIKVMKLLGHRSFRTTQTYVDLVGLDLKGSTNSLSREPSNVVSIEKKKSNS